MITINEYVGQWVNHVDWNPQCKSSADILLQRVNDLLDDYVHDGFTLEINPKTSSQISGEVYGGFRPKSCPIGATKSSHKLGMGVDIYDPNNEIDTWIDENPDVLALFDLYRESAISTNGWCHLSTRKPNSGKRTFLP